MRCHTSLQHMIGLSLALIVLAGCGTPADTPAPTSISPVATSTPIPPTATRPPTPAPPTDTPSPTATPTPGVPAFSREGVLEVPFISATVGSGDASFAEAQDPETVSAAVNGTVQAVDGKVCLFCFETLRIEPGLRIPTDVFVDKDRDELSSVGVQGQAVVHWELETVTASNGKQYTTIKDPRVIDSIQFSAVVLEIPVDADAAGFIVSGPEGATLRKEGHGFRLVEGEAYLLPGAEAPAPTPPGPTPAPPATETPTPGPEAEWPIIMSDPFITNVNDWPSGTLDDEWVTNEWRLTDGKYRWEATAHQHFQRYVHPDTRSVSDFYLTVEVRKTRGTDLGNYGLVFRVMDSDNFYHFGLSDTCEFILMRKLRGQWRAVVDWTRTSAIRPGEVNQLAVRAEGTHFVLFINGQQVAEADDSRLPEGKAGLTVELYRAGETAVIEFDNFELRAP